MASAELQFFSTALAIPAAIIGNNATSYGGAIYLKSNSSSPEDAWAKLWNASLELNTAPTGAAGYFDSGVLAYNRVPFEPSGVSCHTDTDCGHVTGNIASGGSVLHGVNGAVLQLGYQFNLDLPPGGLRIRDNSGTSVIGGSANIYLANALLSGNQTSSDLVSSSDHNLYIHDATLAGNTIGGGSAMVRAVNSAIDIKRSILWQPGVTTLSRVGGTLTTQFLDASENSSLGGASFATVFDPRFVDPAHGDFSLRAASPMVDWAPTITGYDRDAVGLLRDHDLPVKPNAYGPRDAGAFERHSLQPLVLNADFDFSDLRLWTRFVGSWDGTQNAVGAANSGSWKYDSAVDSQDSEVLVGYQCIHVPGPGQYLLNGYGRSRYGSVVFKDYADLDWEFRKNGQESCTNGVVNATGTLRLGSGSTWKHPSQPAVINVSVADWGLNSSITVKLMSRRGNVPIGENFSAWFDGITLDVVEDDVIFRDGFE